MLTVTAGSASELFAGACRAVLPRAGRPRRAAWPPSRCSARHLCLTDPRRRLVDVPPVRADQPGVRRRRDGVDPVRLRRSLDLRLQRRLAEYADDGRLQGAYGPRLRRWGGTIDQLDQVLDATLTADPGTRRAVIQLYDPDATRAATGTCPAPSATASSCATAACTCTPRCAARTCGSVLLRPLLRDAAARADGRMARRRARQLPPPRRLPAPLRARHPRAQSLPPASRQRPQMPR